METLEFSVLAVGSLFLIVDPLATVPSFLAMTAENGVGERLRMARMACSVACVLLLVFSVLGNALFRFLGITIQAFQMAGSIVLLLVALDMVRAQRSKTRETPEEKAEGLEKADVAVTPLAIPMLAGPGAISTVIVLQARARGWLEHAMLVLVIATVMAASYLVLALAARGSRCLSPIALRVTERIMGLLLAAIAFQFLINALTELGVLRAAKM